MHWAALAAAVLGTESRNVLLVGLDAEPGWKEMAYLSAIPASEKVNEGGAALIAIGSTGGFRPEESDYLRRYRPDAAWVMGADPAAVAKDSALPQGRVRSVAAQSAEDAAAALSRQFWKSSRAVVACGDQDYASALIAAPLASRMDSPLLFAKGAGFSATSLKEIKRLGAEELIWIGSGSPAFEGRTTRLSGADDILRYAKERRMEMSYIAAVNPLDRDRFITRRLSLTGAQLAAGRQGWVLPLRHETVWKKPAETKTLDGPLPDGASGGAQLKKTGTFDWAGKRLPFFLTGTADEQNLRLLTQASDGSFTRRQSGDKIDFGGRTWSLSLGTRTRYGGTDAHFTWPTADELREELEAGYRTMGRTPEHLCIVGFPDAIPHAIFGRGGVVEEQASDLPYAILKGEEFARIGVGRMIAEDVRAASLSAARALTYFELADPAWRSAAAQAEWENSFGPLFGAAGFQTPFQFSPDQLPSAPAHEGGRSPSFAQDSPLARCAVLAHSEHSDWTSLGSMFRWDAEVLLAPTIIESGGCGTACLDREPDNRSVVARLLRLGAVSFAGGSRELSAQAQPLRMQFWNSVLSGESIGQAHRRAQNAGILISKLQNEDAGGAYRYSTQVRLQFGDPALRLAERPAGLTGAAAAMAAGSRLTITGPEKWSVLKMHVPPDWKKWADKDLFVVRGPGSISMCSWGPDEHDVETPLVIAEFATAENLSAVELVEPPRAPLGWDGQWFSARQPDGSFVHRLAVRMVDLDQKTGRILASVDRLEFKLTLMN